MLVVGIVYHILFMIDMRRERIMLGRLGLLHAESKFPPSLMIAILLFGVGVSALVAMLTGAGPLG
jgi:putative membrane protein